MENTQEPLLSEATTDELIEELSSRCDSALLAVQRKEGTKSNSIFHMHDNSERMTDSLFLFAVIANNLQNELNLTSKQVCLALKKTLEKLNTWKVDSTDENQLF